MIDDIELLWFNPIVSGRYCHPAKIEIMTAKIMNANESACQASWNDTKLDHQLDPDGFNDRIFHQTYIIKSGINGIK